jgi:hypothetical protein
MSNSHTPPASAPGAPQNDGEQDNRTDPILATEPFENYADVEKVEEALPITSYVALLAVYGIAFAALMAEVKRKEQQHHAPEKMDWCELAISSLAVFQASRTLSKGWVTIPLRAPFAKYEEPSVLPSEVHVTPRGKGLQRVIVKLLTCPFCLGSWVGLGFGYGKVFAPRATEILTGIAATGAVSNFLHFAYTFSCQKTKEA